MRLSILLAPALLFVVACGTKKSACDTVKVRVRASSVLELPVRAEYCLYTPDSAACCKQEGTSCDELTTAQFSAVERAPGCKPTSRTTP